MTEHIVLLLYIDISRISADDHDLQRTCQLACTGSDDTVSEACETASSGSAFPRNP